MTTRLDSAADTGEVSRRLLFCDGLCLVINKPAGWAVHKGPGTGPHLGTWLPLLRQGRSTNPEIAHRLDRDTTGCLVLGRHAKALRKLHTLFSQNLASKVYWAVVEGTLPESEGSIDFALSEKLPEGIVKPDLAGKPALTHYKVLQAGPGWSWVELRPITGRTHQLRVHMAALGCPIKGDKIYGGGMGPMFLHARQIALPLYPRKSPVVVEAPCPDWWTPGFVDPNLI